MNITFDQARRFGFTFPDARAWIGNNKAALARDAALVTTPNSGVPVEFTAFIDPQVVEILTAPRNARRLFDEEKKGDWTTSFDKFQVTEMVGGTEEYSDYANGVTSDVNANWMSRAQYLFQTAITYGDREVALSSMAKIDLAAAKQRAAATKIDIDANRFYLTGVEGMQIYGIFNDPNLPSAITAGATGTGGSTMWADKTTKGIYDDILALFARLQAQTEGLITEQDKLKLCLSPAMNAYLGSATDFNITVKKMLDSYFAQLEIVVFPELAALDGEQTLFLIAPEVTGQKSGTLAFGEKIRAGRVIPDLSSFRQKFIGTTYGGIVYIPAAFASMTGIA